MEVKSDVPTDVEIAVQQFVGENAYHELFEVCQRSGVDPVGAGYSLWVDLTHLLAFAGWTEEDLVKDVREHVQMENEPKVDKAE